MKIRDKLSGRINICSFCDETHFLMWIICEQFLGITKNTLLISFLKYFTYVNLRYYSTTTVYCQNENFRKSNVASLQYQDCQDNQSSAKFHVIKNKNQNFCVNQKPNAINVHSKE